MWFQTFVFLPLPGETIQLDEHIFQRGWFNHQLETGYTPQNEGFTWVPMELGSSFSSQPNPQHDLQAAMKAAIKLAGPGKPYDMKVPTLSFPRKKKGTCCVAWGIYVRDEKLPSYIGIFPWPWHKNPYETTIISMESWRFLFVAHLSFFHWSEDCFYCHEVGWAFD